MTRSGDRGVASPETEDNMNDGIQQSSSALGRELSDLFLMQQSMAVYNGLKKSNKFTEDLANAVEDRATSLYEDIMGTEIGKKADESLASVAAKTKMMAECFVCQQDKEDACHHSPIALAVMKVFHLCFRFCLPLMLLRWWVDAALIFTELALALTQDFVRSGITAARLSRVNSKELEETTEKQPSKEKEVETSKEPHLINFISTTWWDVITYFVSLVYYMTKLFAIFFGIPYLSYQLYFLNAVSCTLHRLAGLDNGDEDQENKTGQHVPAMYYESTKERKLRSNQWMADCVMNRMIAQMMEFPLAGLLLEIVGVKRQFNFFKKLQTAMEGSVFVVSIRENGVPSGLLSVMTDISRLVEGELAPYLNLDDTYNEEDDPDYEPGDSSGDSLDIDDEHLEATNGNDKNSPKRVAESVNLGIKDGNKQSPRKRSDTVSLDDQE